jgi:transcriptional regulator with XRE-family HTH domain
MATRRVEIGPTGEIVRANVARFRRQRGLTLREMADKMKQAGRPLAYNTISEIELGARRVDVDDLAALADVLEVLPTDLLGSGAMEVLHAHTFREVLRVIEEAKLIEGGRSG